MENFDFDYHSWATEWPATGVQTRLGNSYSAVVGPSSPPQRIITLTFPFMVRHANRDGTPNTEIQREINFNRLVAFYARHELWKKFQYQHPTYGLLVVRFKEPLKEPTTRSGGQVESFSISFEEVP